MSLVDERKVTVLSYLHEHGPGTGYSIARSEEVDYTKGYIYDVLSELEDEGMVEVAERESDGRQRVSYQLTENGRLLLEAIGETDAS
jgi:DNA-binding PadR family transcriptional regulator